MTRIEVAVRRRASESFTLDAEFVLDVDGAHPIAALFGPSGCGKSTTLAVIAGLLEPDSGRVAIDGEALVDVARSIRVPPERRAIGVVAQDGLLFPHLDVAGNLDYAERRNRGRPHAPRAEIEDALALGPLLARRTENLSGGERQRAALARALLSGPRLLLLDEPVSALDETSRWTALDLVDRVARRFAVPALYVSHQRDEVLRLATRAARMDAGRVVACGPADEVLAAPQAPGAVPNLLRVTVERGDDARLANGAMVQIPVDGVPGAALWFRLSSGAVALESPGVVPTTSARNRIAGRVVTRWDAPHRVRVAIDAGGVALLADVTPEAAARQALTPGADVVCVFKVHSMEPLA